MNWILQIVSGHLAAESEPERDRGHVSGAICAFARQRPFAFFARLLVCVAIGIAVFAGLFWLFFLAPEIVQRGLGPIVLIAIGFSAYRSVVSVLFRVGPDE